MDIKIRKAKDKDLSSILQLYAHLGMDDGSILTLKQALKIFGRIQTYPDYNLYIAVAKGKVIGTFALLVMDNLGHTGTRSGVVEEVVVHPDYRRRGIGGRMMKFAVDYCRKRDCYKMALSSNVQREDAHRFYEALGFKKHGYSFIVEFADYPNKQKKGD